ncbi:MAG TPA: alkene reductase, partial [Terriglobales bacterium]
MKLFEPNKVGSRVLRHRVVMTSLARMRASEDGLIIAKSTIVSLRDRGYLGVPDLYDDGQVARWKAIANTVHAKGGIVLLQTWHGGWQSHADNEPNHGLPVATSAIANDGVVHTKDGW